MTVGKTAGYSSLVVMVLPKLLASLCQSFRFAVMQRPHVYCYTSFSLSASFSLFQIAYAGGLAHTTELPQDSLLLPESKKVFCADACRSAKMTVTLGLSR